MTNREPRWTDEELQEKLERPRGLCTSIMYDDRDNFQRMVFILNAFLSGQHLEASSRSGNDWRFVADLPQDFAHTTYRVVQ